LVHGATVARPVSSRIAFTSASASAQPRSVSGVGSYRRGPRPSICWEIRIALPVGGGGPNTPSLLSSVIRKIVSQDCHLRRISFFSNPNHDGPVAPGACARIVPRPGGKYSCSMEKRENSGRAPSR
jgi:hypothetical protein